MPIGQGLSKKRPRNDLDDYLDEVDSYLFCVTRADRTCLHRDLKAHVRELTTESSAYQGRYLISRDQLISNIGDPRTISSNYISSVGRKVPSWGLRIYASIILVVFIGIMVMGLERLEVSRLPDIADPGWLSTTGTAMVVGGLAGSIITLGAMIKFQQFHVLLIYLALCSVIISIPFSSYISNEIIHNMGRTWEPMLHYYYMTMFVIDFIIMGIVGIYIYLRHFKVMNQQMDLVI